MRDGAAGLRDWNRSRELYKQDTRRGPVGVGDGSRRSYLENQSGVGEATRDESQVCVLRIQLLVSLKEDPDGTFVFKLLLNEVSSTSDKHDFTLRELSEWTLVDSSDTFPLQISSEPGKKGGVSDVKARFEAHHCSCWSPVVFERTITVEEIMDGEMVQQDCNLTKSHSESENGRVYVTVRVMQKHKTIQREAQFIIRKTLNDIKKLIKRKRNTVKFSLLPSPSKVMPGEYQTCLIMPFMDLMQDTNDDIILTVWMCSIQESTDEFYALQREQKHFSRVRLDTENSFAFSNMDTPITAIVSVLEGSSEVMEVTKEIEPLQIKYGHRAKFQFVCQGVAIFDMVDVRITILQKGKSNKVQFMARKKVELFFE